MNITRLISSIRRLPIAAILVLLTGSPLQAQHLHGVVVDADSDTPIPSATVRLLNRLNDEVRAVLTDSAGRFVLDIPRAGTFRLRAERIGLQAAHTPEFRVEANDSLQMEIRIAADTVLLAPLTVTAMSQGWRSPVLQRRWEERRELNEKLGRGKFIVREEIERNGGSSVTHLVSQRARVRLGPYRNGGRLLIMRGYGDKWCVPALFVNGSRIRTASQPVDDFVSLMDVMAIEVYQRSELPGEYADNPDCGAVAVWTK